MNDVHKRKHRNPGKKNMNRSDGTYESLLNLQRGQHMMDGGEYWFSYRQAPTVRIENNIMFL
jgi:hypothetical protein